MGRATQEALIKEIKYWILLMFAFFFIILKFQFICMCYICVYIYICVICNLNIIRINKYIFSFKTLADRSLQSINLEEIALMECHGERVSGSIN